MKLSCYEANFELVLSFISKFLINRNKVNKKNKTKDVLIFLGKQSATIIVVYIIVLKIMLEYHFQQDCFYKR